ncbi:MAG TPA: MFS transporter [Caulobacteraceae bacterium]|nr:MFS transporter [Caulobacteraceae bacterium]
MASIVTTPSARISWPRLFAFALPGLPIGGLAVALSVYLPRYYASHIGLSLAAVGGAFGVVRLVDMCFDPFIGVAMDHTRTRLGRYRNWLLLAIPLLAIPVYMLFLAPVGVPLIYLIAWLFIYYLGTSVVALSHASWASVVASTYHDRSRVFGVIQVVSTVAATSVLVVPTMLTKNSVAAVQDMGWLIVAATPLGILAASFFTPERIVAEHSTEQVHLRDYVEMALWPEMRRIVAAAFCLTLGPGWMSAMYLFYFHDSRGFSFQVSTLLLALYIVAGVFGAAGLSWLATRLGKHRTLMVASTGYSLGLMLLNFLPKGDLIPAAIIMFALGFLAAGFVLLGRAMCADVGDAIRLAKGKHRQSVLYAMMTSVEKIASALSITFTFTILGFVGYQAKEGAHNTPAAIHNLELVYLLGPITFVMLGGACYLGYKLDHKRHAEIREALDARDAPFDAAAALESLGGDIASPAAAAE